MYKVFFNDRPLFLTDDFSSNFQVRYGLFFKFQHREELEEIVEIYGKLKKIKSLIIFHYDLDELRDIFKSCFVNVDAAGGVIRNEKNEFLFIMRRGRWDLPKGKLDKNEDFQEAAVREVSEECGVGNISVERPLLSTYHTYYLDNSQVLKKTMWFEMTANSKEELKPQADEDIEEVRWFAEEDLAEAFSNTYPLIVDVFKYLGYLG